jgi:beta-lactamase regulating signal transducer with metallopeptidase domain/biotin carboxyl carrier protein
MINSWQWIQIWSHPWAAATWRASIQGGAALVLAWLICRMFRKIPAGLQCWLWRLAYLKLFVGLLWIGPIALPLLKPLTTSIARPIALAAQPADIVPAARVIGELPRPAALPVASHAAVHQPPAPVPVDWPAVLMLGWLAGSVVVLAKVVHQGTASAQLCKSCRPVTDRALLALYARVAADFGISRPPALVISDRATGPLLLGLARPQIVLPPQLPGWSENSCSRRGCSPASPPGTESKLSRYTGPMVFKQTLDASREKLQCLLAHELAHLKRRDLWWSWLPATAAALFWFHPMVWLAGREWRMSRESACDAAAIAVTGSSPTAYGRVLLEIASSWRAPIQPYIALGVIESRHTLERRLLAMRHFSNASARRWIFCGIALMFVGSIALLPWRLVAKEPQKTAAAPAEKSPATQPAWGVDHPVHEHERHFIGATKPDIDFNIWSRDNLVPGSVSAAMAGISARAGGTIEVVACKEGQHVREGQLLFQLNDARAKARLAAAEADLQFSQLDYKRKQQLVQQKAVSPIELQEAESQVSKQEAQVQIAKLDVEETRIVSPLSGIVFSCNALAGQYAQPGSVLARVVDLDSLTIEFPVDADQARLLEAGRKIKIGMRGHDEQVDATIIFVSPLLSGDRIQVKATAENGRHLLKSGMNVTVDLQFYPRPLQSYQGPTKPPGQ